MSSPFFSYCKTCVIVFYNFTQWIPEIKHYCPNTPYILVGTKTDLRRKYKMTIPKEEGINFAKAVKAYTYVECSAKSQVSPVISFGSTNAGK